MVTIPTPPDPSTGLENDPRATMRTLLQQPEPRTPYERKQIDDALARACMTVLSRLEAAEGRILELEQAMVRMGGRKPRRRVPLPAVPPTEPSGPDASGGAVGHDGAGGAAVAPTSPASEPAPATAAGQSGGGSVYEPRPGTVAALVLEVMQGERRHWRNGEMVEQLQRTHPTREFDSHLVSTAFGILYRKGRLKRSRLLSMRGRVYEWAIQE